MKIGDIVRFRDITNHLTRETGPWKLGLLIDMEYKIATILYEGEVTTHWAENVQRAGRRDGLVNK